MQNVHNILGCFSPVIKNSRFLSVIRDRAAVFTSAVTGSTATPIFNSNHGPMIDPDYAYAARESAWVPVDGEMFWHAGKTVYDKGWPAVISAELAAWRLREMHYSTLSLVHGYIDDITAAGTNETIARWMRTPLDVGRLRQDRLPLSQAYATVPHTGFEYVRDHLGYRLELQWAEFPDFITPDGNFSFTAGLINFGFAAPVNPRPVSPPIQDHSLSLVLRCVYQEFVILFAL